MSVKQIEHEIVIPDEGFSFKIFMFEGKNGHYFRSQHWHRSLEIFAVFKGNLSFYINDKPYPLHSGEMILINSNEIHSISSPEPNTTLVLQIPYSLFQKYVERDQMVLFAHSLGSDRELLRLIWEIYQCIRSQRDGEEWRAQSYFSQIMYCLITRYREKKITEEDLRQYRRLDRLSDITAYMSQHYDEELSLSSVAEKFGYSPAYLSRMFRKYGKANYKTCLQTIRLEQAFRELKEGKKTIGEIAMDNGFPNSKAFAREFEKKYGLLPSKYKKDKKLP